MLQQFFFILGGEVCRLIPALSLLKDAKMYKQLKGTFYENVRVCFELKEGASGEYTHFKSPSTLNLVFWGRSWWEKLS